MTSAAASCKKKKDWQMALSMCFHNKNADKHYYSPLSKKMLTDLKLTQEDPQKYGDHPVLYKISEVFLLV
jgi:hypothetical protein